MTLSTRIDQITRVIRPFPIVADRVMRLAREEDVDFQELTQLISTDPALSSLLIGLANSPVYGSIRRPVDSLHRAILVLGRDHVVEAVMVHIMRSVREMVQESWPKGDIYFWQHCVAVGIVTRMLTNTLRLPFTQQALIAGLLHDVGKILLLNDQPRTYRLLLEKARHGEAPLHLLEEEAFGLTHAEVGAAACDKWNLPSDFIETAKEHHQEPELSSGSLANLVRSANLIVKVSHIGDGGNPFVSTNRLNILPTSNIPWRVLRDIISNLPTLVNELTSQIFGSTIASQSSILSNTTKSTSGICIGTKDANERLLLRYVLTAMGHNTYIPLTTEQPASSLRAFKDDIDVVVTDQPEAFPRGEFIIVDYREWRAEQDTDRANDLNTISLRNWLHKQLKYESAFLASV